MNEDEYNFIFGSGSITAFDRALATVTLRTDRNIPGESYPIYATATFGSQIVKLKAGTTEFDVVFEIHEAEMLLNTIQTDLEYGQEYHDHKKVLGTPKDTETIERAKSAKSGSVGGQKVELTAGSEAENQRKENFLGISKQYEHADISHLKIGSRNSDHPLDGTVVRDYQGWVAHRSSLNTRSGV